MNFAPIPDWSRPAAPGKLAFYETIALAGLEDRFIRLSADDQRALLGFPVFGRREIWVDSKNGDVIVKRSVCFGQDSDVAGYTPATVERAASERKQLSPGVSGPKYLF